MEQPVRLQQHRAPNLLVLMYHDILSSDQTLPSGFPGRAADFYKIDKASFRSQLDVLASLKVGSAGESIAFDFGPLELPESLFSIVRLRASFQPVLVTFDDGGKSCASIAADALEQYGMRGVFFIATDYIGKRGFVEATDLRAMRSRGHVIGSHSKSHAIPMTRLPKEQILSEWKESKDVLEQLLGNEVAHASIPGGVSNGEVEALARSTGLRILFGSQPKPNAAIDAQGRLLGRYCVASTTTNTTFRAMVTNQRFVRTREALRWRMKCAVKRLGGAWWYRARDHMFGN